MLNTVLANAVLQTLCWQSFGRTWFGDTNDVNAGFPPVQTLTLGAANGSCEPYLPIFCIATNVHCDVKVKSPSHVGKSRWQARHPSLWHVLKTKRPNDLAVFVLCLILC